MAEEEDKDKAEKPEGEEGKEAEGEGESAPASGDGGKKKKKMIIIAAAVGVVLLLGLGAGLYFAGVFGGEEAKVEAEGAADAHEAKKEGEAGKEGEEVKAVPVFLALGDILVNLSGDGKRPNFLKIKISLELADEKEKAEIESLKPRIVDSFQIYLRELRVDDLRGSSGLYRLREELLLRVTEIVHPLRVRDVLFQEILVQ